MNPHQECYGEMFPDLSELSSDRPSSGKVFTVGLERGDGLLKVNRTITSDQTQWDDCIRCPEFDECYKFCKAKLALATALRQE